MFYSFARPISCALQRSSMHLARLTYIPLLTERTNQEFRSYKHLLLRSKSSALMVDDLGATTP